MVEFMAGKVEILHLNLMMAKDPIYVASSAYRECV